MSTTVNGLGDHKIARTSFLLPASCRKVSTRAFLLYLEQQGLIESASEVRARALRAGRAFSQLRFPTEQGATRRCAVPKSLRFVRTGRPTQLPREGRD